MEKTNWVFAWLMALALLLMLNNIAFAEGDKYCPDADGDFYGDSQGCKNKYEPGYVLNDSDCDDNDPYINPDAMEMWGDYVDQDCDGDPGPYLEGGLAGFGKCILEHTAGSYYMTDLVNLSGLHCAGAHDSDMSGLEYLTGLTSLSVAQNYPLSDVSPLAGLTGLIYLNLGYNRISDISPLANLTNLTQLYLESNYEDGGISNIDILANFDNLTHLNISWTTVNDITALSNLMNLDTVLLAYTCISDYSPVENVRYVWGTGTQNAYCP